MPTLDWIGRSAVVEHHKQVPFRLLKCDPELSHATATPRQRQGALSWRAQRRCLTDRENHALSSCSLTSHGLNCQRRSCRAAWD